jgi:co-chaperonin GroES (HSP10)
MFKPSEKQVNLAHDISQNEMPLPAGYRIAISPLPVDKRMKAADSNKYSVLAAAGFQDKTDTQAEREERGQHFGILCHVGSGAFKGDYGLDDDAPKEGDVVVFNKYAGLRQEFPPSSGDFYHYCNDEDILSHYDRGVLGVENGE